MPTTITFGIPFDSPIADIGARRSRERSVLSVQPPTDRPDGFVTAAFGAITIAARDAIDPTKKLTPAEAAKKVADQLNGAGLTEAVAKATTKLNLGGLDRTQRLLLCNPVAYAAILRSALDDGAGGTLPPEKRLVDFKDTASLLDYVVRQLGAAGGFREQYAAKLVDAVIAARSLNVPANLKTRIVEDIAGRELPAAASKVDSLIGGLLDQRRATLSVENAVDLFVNEGGEIDATRFTPAVRGRMVSHLRELGVNVEKITKTNRSEYDEYFALAYNQAIRSSNGATTDPIDAIRQKGALTDWDFSVDTFDTVEEQGVVAQNILAAGALDYVYNLGERLGIFRLADALVLRWASGAFDAEPGKPSADLYRYWKLRSERISAEERAMMYRRILSKGDGNLLSGMVENEEFPTLWGTLMEKATDFIRRSEENASSERTVSRQPIYQATKQLQYNLTEYATGMAHMQITETYHHLLEAKAVLEHAIDYFSTGSRKSLWTVIERASREWFDEAPNIAAVRSAAIDGNKVFRWIAQFDQSSVVDEEFQEFLDASEAWILAQASDDSEPAVEDDEAAEDEDEDTDESSDDSDWDK